MDAPPLLLLPPPPLWAKRPEAERDVAETRGWAEERANGEKGEGASMFSTEMKGMAKEPEESSGPAGGADREETEGVGALGGPNAKESDEEEEEEEEGVEDEDDVVDVDTVLDDDARTESELDLRKLLISEFVDSVRADSVEVLRMLTGCTPVRSDDSELVRKEGGAADGMEKGEGSGS